VTPIHLILGGFRETKQFRSQDFPYLCHLAVHTHELPKATPLESFVVLHCVLARNEQTPLAELQAVEMSLSTMSLPRDLPFSVTFHPGHLAFFAEAARKP